MSQFRSVLCSFFPNSFTSTVSPDLNSKVNLSLKTVTFSISCRICCSSYSSMLWVAPEGKCSCHQYFCEVRPVQRFPPEPFASAHAACKSHYLMNLLVTLSFLELYFVDFCKSVWQRYS